MLDGLSEKDKAWILAGNSFELSNGGLVPSSLIPLWADPIKIKKGQDFVKRNFFSVIFSHLLSLLFLLCYEPVKNILLITGRSCPAQNSKIRYFSTLLHITRWYEGDLTSPFDPAVQDIVKVRRIHGAISERIKWKNGWGKSISTQPTQTTQNLILALQKELEECDENNNEGTGDELVNRSFPITQLDMAVTLFCFMGFVPLFRNEVGISKTKKEDEGVEGFIHMWAVIGHILGIEEEYNIAIQGREERREMIWKQMLLPYFKKCDERTMALWGWLVDGLNSIIYFLSLKSLLVFITQRLLKVKEECSIWKTLNVWEIFLFYLMEWCFNYWIIASRTFFNNLLLFAIWLFEMKAKFNINI